MIPGTEIREAESGVYVGRPVNVNPLWKEQQF